MAIELMPEGQQQYSLFAADKISTPRTEKASKAIDKLNQRYGTGMVQWQLANRDFLEEIEKI